MPLFKTLMVIGPGLIGSSILRRARSTGQLAERLIVMDKEPAVLKRIEELGLADSVTTEPAMAEEADCVVVSVPVRAIENVVRSLSPHLRPGTIITDVASVRGELDSSILSLLPHGVEYVPSHPMAGTEFSGPDAGFAELFENRWALLIPTPETAPWACGKMQNFWEFCGARVKFIKADEHDRICAMVSHLPHLLAFTICDTADNLSSEMRSAVLDYAASGFRDFTRIAASDPVMWRDIFTANRDVLLETLDRFLRDVQSMADAIRDGDDDAITEKIKRGRSIRRTLIQNKQA
ncbi:prephenate dehydrogenase/arogenate dehydrogenase family protein [Neokomagataea tanensis]|uniref:prephenate dehydrogenase n=1 Tax=Neokomagataea tanensis TaxID=661191 RepID=A0A4Y6VAN4_9PROT|nr:MULTISPECIES: prephenate dehydrogenase/arogenate dehydrogenase family protein [Neokomagataea]QDH25586.1 prephenate dehydrogenase/arogenate dehydrogenase family protein [Neokomagataea tanensis]